MKKKEEYNNELIELTKKDANQFRIGNLVYYEIIDEGWDENNRCIEICEVEVDDLHKLDCGGIIHYAIPLTEEWLLKFGFEKTIWDGYNKDIFLRQDFKYYGWIKDRIWCFVSLKSYKEDAEYKPDFFGRRVLNPIYKDKWIFEEIKRNLIYVHHFQNLYFSLTGDELIILNPTD